MIKQGYKSIDPGLQHVRINHYWTRDEYNLYTIKIPRAEKLKVNLTAGSSWE